jgi:hypothetical protein
MNRRCAHGDCLNRRVQRTNDRVCQSKIVSTEGGVNPQNETLGTRHSLQERNCEWQSNGIQRNSGRHL